MRQSGSVDDEGIELVKPLRTVDTGRLLELIRRRLEAPETVIPYVRDWHDAGKGIARASSAARL